MKILFGVQGTGNGHISRSRILGNALKKSGAEVDFLFSGRDPNHYFDMNDFGDYRTVRGISFSTKKGKIDLRKTVQKIRAFRLIKDVRELNLSSYNTIISDFEPVSAWAAHHQNRLCLGVSNQAICQFLKPKEYSLFAHVIMKYYAPSTTPIGLHWFHFGHKLLPPIIEPVSLKPEEKEHILVYLPFESLSEIVKKLSQLKAVSFISFHPDVKFSLQKDNVRLEPLSKDCFQTILMNCSGIITNAGFALISEALALGKKILTKPVQGQFEQVYNANCLEQLQFATVMNEIDLGIIERWLDMCCSPPVIYPDVASELANWILSGQKESLSSLSARLWSQTVFPLHVIKQINHLGYTI